MQMRSLAMQDLMRRAMFPNNLQPDQVEFVLLSFEGPDAYSKAGGLGVRVSNLAEFLAGKWVSNAFDLHRQP